MIHPASTRKGRILFAPVIAFAIFRQALSRITLEDEISPHFQEETELTGSSESQRENNMGKVVFRYNPMDETSR